MEIKLSISEENDNLHRVKNKNNLHLKKQTAFVLTHMGLGDNICLIPAIRYLSTCYDKVIFVCTYKNKENLELIYSDDENIIMYPVFDYTCISPAWGFDMEKFKEITKDTDLYISGFNMFDKKPNPFNDLPFNFYDDLNIDRNHFWNYYHIAALSKDKDLISKLENTACSDGHPSGVLDYIFIHNISSNGKMFSIEEAEKIFNFDKQKILVVNPCENVYNKDDKFFHIAEQLINYPLFFYQTVIKNASKIIMTDSSFFCLTINIKTVSKKINVKPRIREYYKFENLNKKNEYILW